MQAEGLPENEQPRVVGYIVDNDIVRTLGLELLAGRGFPEVCVICYALRFTQHHGLNELLGSKTISESYTDIDSKIS
jgi:hypothetical protein